MSVCMYSGSTSTCFLHTQRPAPVVALTTDVHIPMCTLLCLLAAGFPVLIIHGRNDKLASAANAEALARRLNAPCVIL